MASKAELRDIAVTLAKGLGITVDVASKNHAELTKLVESLRQQAPVDSAPVSSAPNPGAPPPTPVDIAPPEASPAAPVEKTHRVAKPVAGAPLTSERSQARSNHTGYMIAEGRSVTTMNGDMRHAGAAIKAKDFDADTLSHLLSIGVITKSDT